MVKEKDLAELSYPVAPKIVTKGVPGPKGKKVLKDSHKYESMARGAGGFPLVFDEGKGATIKDPDGNTIELKASCPTPPRTRPRNATSG